MIDDDITKRILNQGVLIFSGKSGTISGNILILVQLMSFVNENQGSKYINQLYNIRFSDLSITDRNVQAVMLLVFVGTVALGVVVWHWCASKSSADATPPKDENDPITPLPSPRSPSPQRRDLSCLPQIVQNHNDIIEKNSFLPWGLLGEEHVNAMLFQQLIFEDNRKDVTILPMLESREVNVLDYTSLPTTKYVVLALSVNQNLHNTALIIDQNENTYTYLDSCGGDCPRDLLQDCKRKGLLKEGYKGFVFTAVTLQTDGWSCGLHVIENVRNFITGRNPSEQQPNGDALYEEYAPRFSEFSKDYGLDDFYHEKELIRRQMIHIRDAIGNAINGNPNHPLITLNIALYECLDQEERDLSLREFAHEHLESNPNDRVGHYLLREAQRFNSDLFKTGLAQSTDESEEKSAERIKAIQTWVSTYCSEKLSAFL